MALSAQLVDITFTFCHIKCDHYSFNFSNVSCNLWIMKKLCSWIRWVSYHIRNCSYNCNEMTFIWLWDDFEMSMRWLWDDYEMTLRYLWYDYEMTIWREWVREWEGELVIYASPLLKKTKTKKAGTDNCTNASHKGSIVSKLFLYKSNLLKRHNNRKSCTCTNYP